jgi:integrase
MRQDTTDATIPGLGVRVSPKGRKTFVLTARYPGSSNPVRRAIGVYGDITLEQARATAREWRDLLRRGIDPAIEAERQRAAEMHRQTVTFGAVFEDWKRDKLAHERRGDEVARDVAREFLPLWRDRPITDIAAHEVHASVKRIKLRGTYQAHNQLGYVRRLFGWAVDQHVYGLEHSPAERLKPKMIIGERKPRDRILTEEEVRVFWRCAKRLPYPHGPLLRMVLLTGCRHEEVAGARWREIDMQARTWTIPSERFKSNAEHRVPLTDDLLALLESLPRFRAGAGDHVFTFTFGRTSTCINGRIKSKFDRRMLRMLRWLARLRGDAPKGIELRPWTIQDLRRTLRTHLAALRIPDHIAEMVIGHGKKGLARVYDQHRYDAEMREALTAWAARLRSIVEPPPPSGAKVVPLYGRA